MTCTDKATFVNLFWSQFGSRTKSQEAINHLIQSSTPKKRNWKSSSNKRLLAILFKFLVHFSFCQSFKFLDDWTSLNPHDEQHLFYLHYLEFPTTNRDSLTIKVRDLALAAKRKANQCKSKKTYKHIWTASNIRHCCKTFLVR